MAGSYHHCIKVHKDGTYSFRGVELLDHLGDAHEALQEMFDVIEVLSGGDKQRILDALKKCGAVHANESVEDYFEYDEDLE